MVKYDGFQKAGESANEMMDALPPAMKVVFGIGNLDLAAASGYYVVFFMYFAVICGIHAIMQGAVVLSKEERDKTADFLLVKPVKRSKVMTQKIIASLVSIVLLNVVTWIGSILVVDIYNSGPSINDLIAKLMISLFFLQILFFAIGLFFGVILRTTKKATGASTAFLLGTFILSAAIDLYEELDVLKYITPFKYFDGKMIYMEGLDTGSIILSSVLSVLAIGISYYMYQKKDLHV